MARPATAKSIESIEVAQRKMQHLIEFLQFVQGGRKFTLKEIAKRFDRSERTIRRYIDLLQYLGIDLDQDFDGQYFIADGCCPLCRKEVPHV